MFTSVSYTHLDVYKRQEKRQRKEATNLENDLFTTLEIVNEMLERGFTFGQLDLYKSQATEFLIEGDTLIPPFIAPVSYTHLDVYKRQT